MCGAPQIPRGVWQSGDFNISLLIPNHVTDGGIFTIVGGKGLILLS
jgi:hypothetical protein